VPIRRTHKETLYKANGYELAQEMLTTGSAIYFNPREQLDA
jgi:hypothetical protein